MPPQSQHPGASPIFRTDFEIRRQAEALGPWFHNLHLPGGVQTRPDHPLGDFPDNKWKLMEPHLPTDLHGWKVLDVGCNAGFYSFQFARRGAEVTAIDVDPRYLAQARWAAGVYGLADRIEFRRLQVYELARSDERFDLVWFMGVFYHLRYPTLALDIIARKTEKLMMFQTLLCPGEEVLEVPENLPLDERDRMCRPGWPKMAFIERRLADDPTNWWAADRACVEALLCASGFRVLARPLPEAWLCRPEPSDPYGMARNLEDEYRAATGQRITDLENIEPRP